MLPVDEEYGITSRIIIKRSNEGGYIIDLFPLVIGDTEHFLCVRGDAFFVCRFSNLSEGVLILLNIGDKLVK